MGAALVIILSLIRAAWFLWSDFWGPTAGTVRIPGAARVLRAYWVSQPQSQEELAALRASVNRGRPYGQPAWQPRTAVHLDLLSSLCDPGRPKKLRVRECGHENGPHTVPFPA